MAAATVASTRTTVFGDRRVVLARLTDPADTNTWITGLQSIENVQLTFAEAAVAADSIAVASISGGTITFSQAGTARNVDALVVGV